LKQKMNSYFSYTIKWEIHNSHAPWTGDGKDSHHTGTLLFNTQNKDHIHWICNPEKE
jgi:hypothetical protein